jgi:hypothetical protein
MFCPFEVLDVKLANWLWLKGKPPVREGFEPSVPFRGTAL